MFRANELGTHFNAAPANGKSVGRSLAISAAIGGMQAIELIQSQETKIPATEETKQITQYCYEHGLTTITAGTYSNVICILVPLVATDAQIDEGLDVLESALAAVADKEGAIVQLVLAAGASREWFWEGGSAVPLGSRQNQRARA